MPRHFSDTPADTMLKKTPIEIDGVTYYMCFDFLALREAERQFMIEGHRASLVVTLQDPFSIDAVCCVFPCAIHRFHPEITWEQAVGMVNLWNIDQIGAAIYQAKQDAMPKKATVDSEEEEAPDVNPQNP
jgi:hypothetical protein